MAAERIKLMEKDRRKMDEKLKGLVKVVEGGVCKAGMIEVRGKVLVEVESEGEVKFGLMIMQGFKK